jgi:hypothetical protein
MYPILRLLKKQLINTFFKYKLFDDLLYTVETT